MKTWPKSRPPREEKKSNSLTEDGIRETHRVAAELGIVFAAPLFNHHC